MDAGRVLRGLRAAVFAVVCVLLAALGHVVMSDATVPAWMLLSAGAATAAGAWCVAGRERGPVLVGLLTVGTQAALHSAFSLGQVLAAGAGGRGTQLSVRQWAAAWMCGAQEMPVSGGHADRMLELMRQQMADVQGMTSMPGMAHPAPHGDMAGMAQHGSAAGMVAAHLLVALLGAVWLWVASGPRSGSYGACRCGCSRRWCSSCGGCCPRRGRRARRPAGAAARGAEVAAGPRDVAAGSAA
ncbi:PE-PGRS family protein [Streptomyces lydicus]|nr:PE-PGRS family protein [Streptomyces lydicus]